jgi:hypothetical protein
MKVLCAVSEYPPGGSGIARAASSMNAMIEEMGHEVEVWHPKKVNSVFSLIDWWNKVGIRLSKGHPYDLLFFHQPMFPHKRLYNMTPSVAYFHVSYQGKAAAFAKWFPHSWERRYYALAARMERSCLKHLAGTRIVSSTRTVSEELGLKDTPVLPFYAGAMGCRALDGEGIAWMGRDAKTKNRPYAERMGVPLDYIAGLSHEEAMDRLKSRRFIMSTSIYEGLSTSTLEGASLGLYPILPDIPAMREIRENLGAGFLFGLEDAKVAGAAVRSFTEEHSYRMPDFRFYERGAVYLRLRACLGL